MATNDLLATPKYATAGTPFDDSRADLILRSSDNILFYVHKLLLSLMSPVFEGMLTLPAQRADDLHDGRPCIPVADHSNKLIKLLTWCDPRCTEFAMTLDDLQVVLEMADKYGMECIIRRVEIFLLSSQHVIEENPLALYAVAIRYRFECLAPVAAKKTLQIPLLGRRNIPEMKHISAFALQNLIDYHHRCSTTAVSVANNHQWVSRDSAPSAFFSMPCGSIETCKAVGSGDNRWLGWWLEYMKQVSQELEQCPVPSKAQKASLLATISSEIGGGPCSNCRQYGHDKLVKFAQIFADELEKRIAEVPFVVEY